MTSIKRGNASVAQGKQHWANRWVLTLPVCLWLCGCAHLESQPPARTESVLSEKLEVRNNSASLLYDLMGDEKNVSKILIVKHNSQELGDLIKTIAATAAAIKNQLEQLATRDPDLNLHRMSLPAGEKAAREATSKTKEHELLFSSGKEFEFNLLFSQAEALNYGRHLARVAAENSSSTSEIKTFTAMEEGMDRLYKQVITRMN